MIRGESERTVSEQSDSVRSIEVRSVPKRALNHSRSVSRSEISAAGASQSWEAIETI